MANVVGVRFRGAGKIYYFDPDVFDIKVGDKVIVETARGVEFGNVVMGKREIGDDEIVAPLKKVIRIATEEDIKIKEENDKRKSLRVCLKKSTRAGDVASMWIPLIRITFFFTLIMGGFRI